MTSTGQIHGPFGLFRRFLRQNKWDKASHGRRTSKELFMIATEAALYGRSSASGSGVPTLVVCGVAEEIPAAELALCPRGVPFLGAPPPPPQPRAPGPAVRVTS